MSQPPKLRPGYHHSAAACMNLMQKRCECAVPWYALRYHCCGWYCGRCGGALRKRMPSEMVGAPTRPSAD